MRLIPIWYLTVGVDNSHRLDLIYDKPYRRILPEGHTEVNTT